MCSSTARLRSKTACTPAYWLAARCASKCAQQGTAAPIYLLVSEARPLGRAPEKPDGQVGLRQLALPDGRASAMQAVIFEQHGGPEVLKLTEVADPQIKADEVL